MEDEAGITNTLLETLSVLEGLRFAGRFQAVEKDPKRNDDALNRVDTEMDAGKGSVALRSGAISVRIVFLDFDGAKGLVFFNPDDALGAAVFRIIWHGVVEGVFLGVLPGC